MAAEFRTLPPATAPKSVMTKCRVAEAFASAESCARSAGWAERNAAAAARRKDGGSRNEVMGLGASDRPETVPLKITEGKRIGAARSSGVLLDEFNFVALRRVDESEDSAAAGPGGPVAQGIALPGQLRGEGGQ